MPSTHSAAITYYAMYTLLAASTLPLHPSIPSWTRRIGPLIVLPWATAIAVSRTWLGHHTWPQVGAGCLFGFTFSLIWYSAWVKGLNAYGQVVEKTVNALFR
jgi:dolichyldiphosphatase